MCAKEETKSEICNAKQWNFGVFFNSSEKLTFIKIWFQIDNDANNSTEMQKQFLQQQELQEKQEQQSYSPSQLQLKKIQPIESFEISHPISILKRSRSVDHDTEEVQRYQEELRAIDNEMVNIKLCFIFL